MDASTADLSSDLLSDASELASWTRERTTEELRSFVNSHHALLPTSIDIE